MLILTFMVLPIITLTIIFNYSSTNSLLEQTRINDLQTIHTLSNTADLMLDSYESLSTMIASDPDILRFFQETASYSPADFAGAKQPASVNRYLAFSEFLLGISLVNKDGLFADDQPFDRYQLSYSFPKRFFQELPAVPFIQKYTLTLKENNSSETVFALSCISPVYSHNELLGYVILYIDRNQLDTLVEGLSNTTYLLLNTDDNSNYILSGWNPSGRIPYQYKYSLYSETRIDYNYLKNDSSIITRMNGEKVTLTFQKYPRMNWGFLIISPFSHINSKVISYTIQISGTCIAAIIFALISSYLISHTVTRPLSGLEHTMKKINDGNLNIRYHVLTNDEIGVLGHSFNSLLDKIQELMKNMAEQQQTERKLQLQLIQAQVNPHFLYNVLNMISSFIRDHLPDYALRSITHLANFYRISLSDGVDIITISQEKKMLENYLYLQHLRYIEFMDFSFDISDDILPCQIPKLTLQPLVENAIDHGLKAKTEKGLLIVRGYLKQNRVYLEVYDNGVGMTQEKSAAVIESLSQKQISKDFGISSVMRRLNIYYNDTADIRITSEPGEYTSIILSFPAKSINKEI